jgi:hypothetical protein
MIILNGSSSGIWLLLSIPELFDKYVYKSVVLPFCLSDRYETVTKEKDI